MITILSGYTEHLLNIFKGKNILQISGKDNIFFIKEKIIEKYDGKELYLIGEMFNTEKGRNQVKEELKKYTIIEKQYFPNMGMLLKKGGYSFETMKKDLAFFQEIEGTTNLIDNSDKNFLENNSNKYINDFFLGNIEFFFLLKNEENFMLMNGVEQTGKFHKENLVEHISMILDNIDKYKSNNFVKDNIKILKLLAIFHDIGKPLTIKTKKEILEKKGYKRIKENFFFKSSMIQVENENYISFLNHENISYYMCKYFYEDILKKLLGEKYNDFLYVVKNHLMFNMAKEEDIKDNVKIDNENFKFDINNLSYKDNLLLYFYNFDHISRISDQIQIEKEHLRVL